MTGKVSRTHSRRRRSHERRQLAKGLAFIAPWLFGFVALTLLPIVLSAWYSLTDYALVPRGGPVFIGLENYRRLIWERHADGSIGDPHFWTVLKNTFGYAAIAIPSAMFVSLGLALMLNVKVRGQSIYRAIIFLPSLVPAVASAMLWMWMYNARLGLINDILLRAASLIGITVQNPPGWLSSARLAMPALILMSLWGVGNTVVIYLAGLQDVPRELYEAAEIDGAGTWRRLWHVTLPMLSPVIFFNLVMSIIYTLQVFSLPQIMTGGGPVESTLFYSMYLYNNAFLYLKMGYASAMAWVQLLIVLALTVVAFWSGRRWVHYQAK